MGIGESEVPLLLAEPQLGALVMSSDEPGVPNGRVLVDGTDGFPGVIFGTDGNISGEL